MARMVVSLSVTPLGTGGTSVSRYVREVLGVIREMGLRHRVGAGFTDVELDNFADLARLLEEVHGRLAAMGVARVSTVIKVDYRTDAELSIEGKIDRVA